MSVQTRLVMGSPRELGTVALVAGLSGWYAATLIMTSTILDATAKVTGGSAALVFLIVSGVFIMIALYVSVIVMSNCVDTVIAGRLRHLALLRLLGAGGRELRSAIWRSTAVAGIGGALVGILVGAVLTGLTRAVLVQRRSLPVADYPLATWHLAFVVVAIALAATIAGRLGSRAALRVTPAQAIAAARPTPRSAARLATWRATLALLALLGGAIALVMAWRVGRTDPQVGFPLAFLGAAGSGTGLLIGAQLVMPRVVAFFGQALGGAPAPLIARRNAVADPLRTTRSTMGLTIGVTLVTTIAQGMAALRVITDAMELTTEQRALADRIMVTTSAVLICIVVISALIAAVGFVSIMSLTVVQRRRELGLVRALGFTRGQVRAMITTESIALAASAALLGVILGLIYGTVGAQSLMGSQASGLHIAVPWSTIGVIALAALGLVLAASWRPAQRAIAITPVQALRIES